MNKLKLATVWLGGCSGCHMSFLDLDEWLFDLAKQVDLVYSPIADIKEYPEGVDIVLVEGAVANEDNLKLIKQVRDRSSLLISFGDCAVTGNITAMRNPLGDPESILQRCYLEAADIQNQIPHEPEIVPTLLEQVLPVHKIVKVDIYLPGCPPDAKRIRAALEPLLSGEMPQLTSEQIRFG